MKRPTTRLLWLVPCVLLLSACWPFGKDDEVKPSELVDFQSTLKVKRIWSTVIGKGDQIAGLRLAPVYDGGFIYAAASDGALLSVNAESGKQRWKLQTELPISAGPGVADGLIVVGTIEGVVMAFAADTGTERWRAQASSEILATPAIHNGTVIVRSQDGRVYGLNAETGTRIWVFDRSVPALSLRGNSAPVARGGYVYVGFDSGRVAALRVSDGALAWEQSVGNPEGRTELQRMVDVDGAIAVVASDLYAVGYQGRLVSLTADSGRLLWVREFSSHSGVTILRTQLNITDSEDAVWGLDRLSGGTMWKQDQLARRLITGPARLGSSVIVGDYQGYLHFLSDDDGSFQARIQTGGAAIVATPIAIGKTLFVLGSSGRLSAYQIE